MLFFFVPCQLSFSVSFKKKKEEKFCNAYGFVSIFFFWMVICIHLCGPIWIYPQIKSGPHLYQYCRLIIPENLGWYLWYLVKHPNEQRITPSVLSMLLFIVLWLKINTIAIILFVWMVTKGWLFEFYLSMHFYQYISFCHNFITIHDHIYLDHGWK